jgi:hypothetical protein
MFLGSVSAGLVALGLIATAARIGTTFYAFGAVLLATLAFVGFVTLERVLQSGTGGHHPLHVAGPVVRLVPGGLDPRMQLAVCCAGCALSPRTGCPGEQTAPDKTFRNGRVGHV